MAEDDLSSNAYGNGQSENDVDPEVPQQIRLDLGDNSSRNPDLNRLGNQNVGASALQTIFGYCAFREVQVLMKDKKREDNPFSFKHFLRSDSSGNYQNKGARPKVYCENRATPTSEVTNQIPESKQSRMVPEFSSALPDFVQDHLVIEQCYLAGNSSNNYNLDMNNLPDFAHSRNNRSKFKDDLNSHVSTNGASMSIPLDLPVRPQGSFPLDLPIGNPPSGLRNSSTGSEKKYDRRSMIEKYWDQLEIQKVCQIFSLIVQYVLKKGETMSALHSPESESERLRHELDVTKRQLAEQTRLCDCLSRELEIARNKEHEYTQNLAKALEQVEDNLERSNNK
ncbi:hypothetical protein NQ318_016139 [Aromia moschata]|uniref:Endosome-associated-trafficking regulator 1 n=1 Tax=Aromia moschata TaxID=1265417 RepID=A0AAV8Y2D1_9CUCU|nr:hypothetical protein NQ318_016139 [Aromia moschata]